MFNGELHALQPGQFITGRKSLAKETGISESKCERLLTFFKTEQQIEQQKTNKFRIISILNWSEYQTSEQQNEQPVNNKRTTTEQQLNTIKKEKKDKNEKKSNIGEIPEWINKETWEAFIEMRKVIKKPMTNRAVLLMVNKLEKFKYAGHNVNEILNQSILNNWQDVFELRGENGKGRYVQGDRRTLREREVDAEAERINAEYEKHKASKAATAKNAGQDAT